MKQYKEEKQKISKEIAVSRKSPEENNEIKANEEIKLVWFADFKGDRVAGVNRKKEIVWDQHMGSPPILPASYATNTEYVTVADDGNLIVADGDGMMVQEIDRKTHQLLWQYGVKDKQDYAGGKIHQPDKSFKISENEILINDGNNRRVIIVDQDTNKIVWQYGTYRKMGWGPNLLRGNTAVRPIKNATQFVITDTLEKKVIIVDRATKKILHRWSFPDAKWIQHAWYTKAGGLA
ncbi:MAG: PQQ-binding-like beta-propeller repeat protein [Thermoplasmatota archaeon]